MKSIIAVAFLFVSSLSLAADEKPNREKLERRLRTLLIVELSEQLNLSSAQAARIDEIFRTFDAKRRPLNDQQLEYSRVLRRAAEGDPSAVQQVDAAIDGIFDIRAQWTQIDKEMMRYLARELSAEQRAKMALVFGSIREQMRQEIQKEHQKEHQKVRPTEARKSPEK